MTALKLPGYQNDLLGELRHSFIHSFTLGESPYNKEFVNNMAKLVLTDEDDKQGFVHVVSIVSFPHQSSEWFQLSFAY